MIHPHYSTDSDIPGLIELWHTVFGDSDLIIHSFFDNLYRSGNASVIKENGRVVSAAHVIHLDDISYIYAVATLPEYRGKGYGRAVTAHAAGNLPCYLFPANDELRQWYKTVLGARDICIAPSTDSFSLLHVEKVTPAEYNDAREKALLNIPHIHYSHEFLSFYETMGNFWKNGSQYAAIDSDGIVKELFPFKPTHKPYVMALNDAIPLYFGLVLN